MSRAHAYVQFLKRSTSQFQKNCLFHSINVQKFSAQLLSDAWVKLMRSQVHKVDELCLSRVVLNQDGKKQSQISYHTLHTIVAINL